MSVQPYTTDHALIRYVERAWGWDVARIERNLVVAGQPAAPIDVIGRLVDEYGLDVMQTKKMLSQAARLSKPPRERQRDVYIRWRGVRLVVRDCALVTVLDAGMLPITAKRRNRRRKRG